MDDLEVRVKQVRRSDLPYDGGSQICASCEADVPYFQLVASYVLLLDADECVGDIVLFEERPSDFA